MKSGNRVERALEIQGAAVKPGNMINVKYLKKDEKFTK